MSISEKYYYKNVNPSEKHIRSGSEYQKLNKELCAHIKKGFRC